MTKACVARESRYRAGIGTPCVRISRLHKGLWGLLHSIAVSCTFDHRGMILVSEDRLDTGLQQLQAYFIERGVDHGAGTVSAL
jgi:hypothetical protein